MSLDIGLRKAAASEAAKIAGALARALESLPPAPEHGDPLVAVSGLYADLGVALAMIPSATEAPAPLSLVTPPPPEAPPPEPTPRRPRPKE